MSIITKLIAMSQHDTYACNVSVYGHVWDRVKYVICTPIKYNYIIKAFETAAIETILIHSAAYITRNIV